MLLGRRERRSFGTAGRRNFARQRMADDLQHLTANEQHISRSGLPAQFRELFRHLMTGGKQAWRAAFFAREFVEIVPLGHGWQTAHQFRAEAKIRQSHGGQLA